MAYDDAPQQLKSFLFYLNVVTGKSDKTVYEYYLDLRYFLKFIKKSKYSLDCDIKSIDISDIDTDFLKKITLADTYEYLYYMKECQHCKSTTLNRKTSSIRAFFKYLTNKSGELAVNPVENLECNSLPRRLPKYLSLDECKALLYTTERGNNKLRDFAILTLFLNCGMRLSELVGINLTDLRGDYLTITGKGNKQRSIYLNKACKEAIDEYLKKERPYDNLSDDARNALFISRNGNRISRRMVQYTVTNHLAKAGLSDMHYSTHKLRHTAATLMHKYGNVDIRVLQEVLGHENLGTTQIYTHVDSDQVKAAVDSNPLSAVSRNKIDGNNN